MSWIVHHSRSEQFASQAELATKAGDGGRSAELYRSAAVEEVLALGELDPSKVRTIGITVVSAAALWLKAGEFEQVEQLALQWLGNDQLPDFARMELRSILQSAWGEEQFRQLGISFGKRDVLISLSGGEVLFGAAPLDLVHRKVDEVRNILYRVIELLLGRPLRQRGQPSAEIQDRFRPWLLQASPGSYQFAVRIEQSQQLALFPEIELREDEIATKFLEIVGAAVQDPEGAFQKVVPDVDYRKTFLTMTRNLAPTGKSYKRLEMSPGDDRGAGAVVMGPESRSEIDQSLQRVTRVVKAPSDTHYERIAGVLRAVHLDKDWMVVHRDDGEAMRVERAGDPIDDIVGPMVNHRVLVDVAVRGKKYFYRDIQLDE